MVTLILGFIIDKTIGFRVKPESEIAGIDLSEHAESAYEMAPSSKVESSVLEVEAFDTPHVTQVDASPLTPDRAIKFTRELAARLK